MSYSAVSTTSGSTSSERFTGRVKWFNNKSGYGFITVTDGPKSGTDVFVHHSSIKVDTQQYKYLFQGEYVEFRLSETKTDNHEFQAGEVCGINGGKLMCETRHDIRIARSNYNHNETTEQVKMPKSVVPPSETQNQPKRTKVEKPREKHSEKPREESSEWTYVSKARKGTQTEQTSSPQETVNRSRGRGRPPKNNTTTTSL
jgi:CspA family cold shock protein